LFIHSETFLVESVGRTLGRHSRHGTRGSCEFTPCRLVLTRPLSARVRDIKVK
jgi:hypothetical protein